MSKKLTEVFIFGKVIDVQNLAISASLGGGGRAGNDLSRENVPIPLVRSDASLYQ